MNVPVPDPPAHQVEVENIEAATTNNEANDVVMAEANVEPAPEVNVAPEAHADNANAPVPLQDLIQLSWHLIEVSPLWSAGSFWFLHLLRVHNLSTTLSTDLKSKSPSQDFHDSQALQLHLGSSM